MCGDKDLEKASKKLVLVKKENVELKKIIHWNKWRPASCSGEGRDLGENAMCEICGKLFQFESYLVMHLNRRHPGVVNHQMRSQESYMQSFEKEPGECGEVSPPSGGVPGGGTTSKNRDRGSVEHVYSMPI
ncbi:uncharacterized protein LOC113472074 [Diaphorina citri]|uniref:Uncharacterized protein LOC113472074 n=1 Tax=Diaphorina citri TaxID=121845 RepID=A0A3Q0JKS5_DIACI|nr:uncharacterized protein LOC113472074 [Diaphorina citri]